jgi:predicted amidohydrolase YtcJ
MPVASLVILDANIVTLNPEQPKAEAIAIQNGRIVAVGSNSEIRKHVGMDTKIVNANGKTLVPGLVDCHVHMTGFGFFLQSPDLKNVQSIKEMQRMLQEHASKNPGKGWVLGGRWDHEKLAEKRYPNRWDLDAAVPDRPVFLVRVCGHIGLANSEALRIAAITEKTVVEGGEIELDETSGQPNGILKEDAMRLIWKKVPKPSLKDIEEASLLACTKAVEAGLTGVHWITDSADEIQAILNIDSEGKLPLRVHLGVPPKLLERRVNLHLSTRAPNSKVKMGFVKLFADGSLGSRTAALKEPYSDEPSSNGLLLHPKKELCQLVLAVHKTGQQLAIHAIGDRAVENVLDAYEEALKRYPRKDHRHRIEHCSILNPELIKRLKTLGLIASVQPHFIVSDFWLVDRVGKERARTAFPFKTLTKEGVLVISGSDCPVERINPLLGIWAAVAQRGSEESLTTEQALKTYTVNAAYASFDETERGTIEAGKLADFTILSDDLMSVEPDNIKKIKVETTVVNGEIVYSHKDSTGVNVK